MIKCKICNEKSNKIFSSNLILNKYTANYFKCSNCGFTFIDNPFWLDEAYKNPIHEIDNGILKRNIKFSNILSKLIRSEFNSNLNFLDYGGGYGIFTRLMRDKGFNFFSYDKYALNLISKEFTIHKLKDESFEIITLLEVLEHQENPLKFLNKILTHTKNIFISTEIIDKDIKKIDDWHYFAPLAGQHISFFSVRSLEIIAEKYQLNLITDKKCMHFLTSKELKNIDLLNYSKPITLRKKIYLKLKNLFNF